MKIALFTNCRDEHNIIEWAIYHHLLGFDGIVIFDHLSKIPIKSYLHNVIPAIIVIREESTAAPKRFLYQKAAQMARTGQFTHLLYIDSDEYVVLKKHKKIQDLVGELGPEKPGIALNWVPYGNSDLIFRNNQFLIESQTFRTKYHLSNRFFDHVKTLQRVDAIFGTIVNPHYFLYRKGKASVDVLGRPLVDNTFAPFNEQFLSLAYLAHFRNQSLEDYQLRHVLRTSDDTGHFKHVTFVIPPEQFSISDPFLKNAYTAQIQQLMKQFGLVAMNLQLKLTGCPRLIDPDQLSKFQNMTKDAKIQYLKTCFERKRQESQISVRKTNPMAISSRVPHVPSLPPTVEASRASVSVSAPARVSARAPKLTLTSQVRNPLTMNCLLASYAIKSKRII